MKAILALLVTSLVSPVFAKNVSSTTSRTTDTTTTHSLNPHPSSTGNPAFEDDEYPLSGSSTRAPASSDFGNQDPALSGSATDANEIPAEAPATGLAPAPSAPATATTSETTTTRTYREDSSAETRRFGGFFIEPAIFGSRQDADLQSNIGADTTGTTNGFGADLKLGGHVGEMFFLGADGRYERARFEGSALDDTDVNAWNWGPTAGLQAPFFGLRAWGTYVVDGTYNPDAGARAVDLRFTDPYGWRGGVGIRLSSVSLNLEYEDLTYRTTEVESIGDLAVGAETNADFVQRGYALSLSFPVEL